MRINHDIYGDLVQKKKNLELHTRKRKELPKWLTNHFKESLDSLQQLMDIVHISARGIGGLRGMPKLVQVLAEIEKKDQDVEAADRLARAQKEATLASDEVAKGFPVLHGFAVVALWSWLEHFVKGLVALWLLHRRDALDAPVIQKLKIRFGEYMRLQKSEQAQFLVELLEQELASPLKRGADRFQTLLEPFGLSCALPDGNSRVLFELQQVRNVIAHRNSRADRRFRSDCPWIKLKLNQPVHVNRKMFEAYANAASQFLLTHLYHAGELYGMNLREGQEASIND